VKFLVYFGVEIYEKLYALFSDIFENALGFCIAHSHDVYSMLALALPKSD
jgi:hypothetical protein